MKNLFTIVFIFVAFNISFAQEYAKKGVVELSGSISYASVTAVWDGKTSDVSTSMLTFSPGIGFFLLDNVQIGLVPSYTYLKSGKATQSTVGIAAQPGFVFNLDSKVFPFVNALVSYNSSTSNSGMTNAKDETSKSYSIGVIGGLKIQIGDNGLMSIGAGYTMLTQVIDGWKGDRVGDNTISLNVGYSLFLGGR